MTIHRAMNWLLAVAYVGLLILIQHLDDDRFGLSLRSQMERDIAAEAQDSREWAARRVCGENAAWQWRGDDLQCISKHGKKIGRPVSVATQVTP